ncbi:MAG: hypothetical protein ABIH99_05670 [Candidatus Micrarchaeota archaeon]
MDDFIEILKHSAESYFKNLAILAFFSISFFLAVIIHRFSPMPTFVANGAVFLRTGSIPEMGVADIVLIVLSYIVSLILSSFGYVAVNLVIKTQRSGARLSSEVLAGIEKYTFSIFWLLLSAFLLSVIVSIISFEYGLERILTPLAAFIISLAVFYAPAAIVIDERRPVRAIQTSLQLVAKKALYFVFWCLIAIAVLALLQLIIYAIAPHNLATDILLFLNAVFLLPFLVVLQTQIFISKYTLLA